MRASCGGKAPDYKMQWEDVARDTDRLKIPEGYIYRTKAGSTGDPAMVFVPTREPSLVELDQAHRAKGREIPADRVRHAPVVAEVQTAVLGFCGWCTDPIRCKTAGHCVPGREPIPPGMSAGGMEERDAAARATLNNIANTPTLPETLCVPMANTNDPYCGVCEQGPCQRALPPLGKCNALGCPAQAVNHVEGGWQFCEEHTRHGKIDPPRAEVPRCRHGFGPDRPCGECGPMGL